MSNLMKEIEICDICNDDTKRFTYYEILNSPFGPIQENTLQIDVCEACAKAMNGNFPKELFNERYDGQWVKPMNYKELIEDLVKERGFRPKNYKNY